VAESVFSVAEMSETWDPYAVLGIAPGTALRDARRAYLRRVEELHPDRLHDTPAAVRLGAENQLKDINRAWSDIRRGPADTAGPAPPHDRVAAAVTRDPVVRRVRALVAPDRHRPLAHEVITIPIAFAAAHDRVRSELERPAAVSSVGAFVHKVPQVAFVLEDPSGITWRIAQNTD